MNYIITLVHGTWARGAHWTKSGSNLRSHIETFLNDADIEFRPFDWSGRNSQSARLNAARELTDHLQKGIKDFPHAKHYVIGHSHGGAVALRALHDEQLAARVDGVVCLSTPFISVQPGPLLPEAAPLLVISELKTKLFTLFWALTILLLFGWYQWYQMSVDKWSELLGLIALTIAVPLGAIWAINAWVNWIHNIPDRYKFANFSRDTRKKVLILRSAGDEASAILAAAQFWGWLTRIIWSYIFEMSEVNRTVRIFFGLVRDGGASILDPVVTLLRNVFFILEVGFFGLTIGIAIILFLPVSLVLMCFGVDLFFSGFFLQQSVEATPPGQWQVVRSDSQYRPYYVSAEPRALVHSEIYANSNALGIIVAWMRERDNFAL